MPWITTNDLLLQLLLLLTAVVLSWRLDREKVCNKYEKNTNEIKRLREHCWSEKWAGGGEKTSFVYTILYRLIHRIVLGEAAADIFQPVFGINCRRAMGQFSFGRLTGRVAVPSLEFDFSLTFSLFCLSSPVCIARYAKTMRTIILSLSLLFSCAVYPSKAHKTLVESKKIPDKIPCRFNRLRLMRIPFNLSLDG